MIAIDTNVLVRVLIDDPDQHSQVTSARQFAKKNKKLFIPQIVQIELAWVLSSAYRIEKISIIHILKHLYENAAFVLQNENLFGSALHLFQTSNVDFSDCLILTESQEAQCQVATFDKKFSKLPNTQLIS